MTAQYLAHRDSADIIIFVMWVRCTTVNEESCVLIRIPGETLNHHRILLICIGGTVMTCVIHNYGNMKISFYWLSRHNTHITWITYLNHTLVEKGPIVPVRKGL